MANVGHPSPSLAEEATLGYLLAFSEARALPARPWPVVAGCQSLANDLLIGSPFREVALRISGNGSHGKIEHWFMDLATRGQVRPERQGIRARWVVSDAWVKQWSVDSMEGAERGAFEAAAQRLNLCLSIWRKTVAAAEKGSGSSTVGERRT